MPNIEWNMRWGDEFAALTDHEKITYGLQWGDPTAGGHTFSWDPKDPSLKKVNLGPLHRVVDNYILNNPRRFGSVLEIGPGAGKWTRYFLDSSELVLVDIHDAFLDYLGATIHHPHLRLVKNDGRTLDGCEANSIDFAFCFDVFVTLDEASIFSYLSELQRVLKPGGDCVLQYADVTKPRCQQFGGFVLLDGDQMAAHIQSTSVVLDRHLLDYCSILTGRKRGLLLT